MDLHRAAVLRDTTRRGSGVSHQMPRSVPAGLAVNPAHGESDNVIVSHPHPASGSVPHPAPRSAPHPTPESVSHPASGSAPHPAPGSVPHPHPAGSVIHLASRSVLDHQALTRADTYHIFFRFKLKDSILHSPMKIQPIATLPKLLEEGGVHDGQHPLPEQQRFKWDMTQNLYESKHEDGICKLVYSYRSELDSCALKPLLNLFRYGEYRRAIFAFPKWLAEGGRARIQSY